MARDPIIFAMANPTPEILPEDALAVRPDAIIGTGRSDYPNQVNNVLCFPFIFRGALDCRRDDDQRGDEARRRARDRRARARRDPRGGGAGLRRRRPALRPRLPDPEALRSAPDRGGGAGGGAGRGRQRRRARGRSPTLQAYRQRLRRFVYQSGSAMQPVFAAAKRSPKSRGLRRRRGRARAARRAGGGRRRAGAAAAARPARRDRRAHRASSACACSPARTATSSTCSTRRSTATPPTTYYQLAQARRRLARAGARRDAQPLHAAGGDDAAPWARPTRCCAAPSAATADHLQPCARRDRPARRRRARWRRCRC